MAHRKYLTIDSAEVREILRRLKNKEIPKSIEQDLNLSTNVVYYWKMKLIQNGYLEILEPLPKKERKSKGINYYEIKFLITKGYTQQAIAHSYGVSRQRIHQIKNVVMHSL